MSNKAQLQENNIDLQQILQSVQDLPTAVPWGGSTIIEPGSEAVTIPAYTDTDLTVNPVQTEEKTVTPSGSQQIITPAAGKYLSKVTVGAIPDSYMDFISFVGYSQVEKVTFTPSSNTTLNRKTINHSLGVSPKMVMILSDMMEIGAQQGLYFSIAVSRIGSSTLTGLQFIAYAMDVDTRDYPMTVTASTAELITDAAGIYYTGGQEYTVLLFA